MEIILRNQIIPYKESTQFWRVTIDSSFNWKKHIDRVKAKTMSSKHYQNGSSNNVGRMPKANCKVQYVVQR